MGVRLCSVPRAGCTVDTCIAENYLPVFVSLGVFWGQGLYYWGMYLWDTTSIHLLTYLLVDPAYLYEYVVRYIPDKKPPIPNQAYRHTCDI